MKTQTEWAIRNLELAGWMSKESDYDGMIGEAVKKLLLEHQKEGHSGASHHITVNLFREVALGNALTMEYWREHFEAFNEFAKANGSEPFTEEQYESIHPKPKKLESDTESNK